MTTRLRAARDHRNLKQAAVIRAILAKAEVAGLSVANPASLKALLSAWENGHRPVPQQYRPILRSIYGMADDELFNVDAESGDDLNHQLGDLATRIAAAKSVDGAAIDLLAAQTNTLRKVDRQNGAPILIDRMNAHLNNLSDVLSHAFLGRVRRPVAGLLADAAALAGWFAMDAGAVDRAWQRHELARQAAHECEDPVLLAHAMGQQAVSLADLEEYELAIELIEEARTTARTKTPGRLQAWLLATEAEIYAGAGMATQAYRALDAAATLIPDIAVDPAMPYLVLDESHFGRWRGNVLARIGDGEAVETLLSALRQHDSAYQRAEASLLCDLAYAYAVRGERDEARVHATRARRLIARTGSVRQRRRLDRLALV